MYICGMIKGIEPSRTRHISDASRPDAFNEVTVWPDAKIRKRPCELD